MTIARSSPARPDPPLMPLLVAILCLPLPLELWVAFISQLSPQPFFELIGIAFFFTYLFVLAAAICVVEPLVVITAVVYTARANRDGQWSWTLMVCWAALILHTAAIAWTFYVSAAGPRGVWGR